MKNPKTIPKRVHSQRELQSQWWYLMYFSEAEQETSVMSDDLIFCQEKEQSEKEQW